MALMTPFQSAYAEARRKWEKGEGPATFDFDGKKYAVTSREEAARQKEMKESPMRGRGMGRAETPAPDTTSQRAVIPGGGRETEVEEPTRGSRFGAGLGDTAAKTLAALGAGAGVVGLASKLSKADKAAEAARIAREEGRIAPTLRRTGAAAEADRAAAREALTREPPMSRAASAAEKSAPAMQAEKARSTPRMRTRERDEEAVEFKRGGAVRGRGDGICRRGHTKGTMR